jgi:hypothetical protein
VTNSATATGQPADGTYVTSNTATITKAQATPKLTWTPNPLANIVYGTKLGNTPSCNDLDATAKDPTTRNTVYGQFVYTDETGAVVTADTVLSVGTHTLTATFTPDDTTDYVSGGTVTNSINVLKTFLPDPNGYSFPNYPNRNYPSINPHYPA